jgi:glycosyltransferase involved in cell wall biosynthesis
MKFKVAIDASRARSGGAISHLIGIINVAQPLDYEISEVHIWASSKLSSLLPSKSWLVIHHHSFIEKNIFFQMFWQLFLLRWEIKKNNCDILLSLAAGTLYVHKPSVVMSRDMLSFESSEINRYLSVKTIIPWLRLYLLRFVQINSLKKATVALFLTNYAAQTILKWTGPLSNYRIIPHGVGSDFKNIDLSNPWPVDDSTPIRCLYVSNTALYKHQWHVVEAFHLLRKEGFNVIIEFVGGGSGESRKKLELAINNFDPDRKFTIVNEFLEKRKLPVKLSQAHIFVFASSCENMPNTLLEAMAVGLPIACSNRGPMPEVLKDAGVYFEPENPQSIYTAVKSLLEDSELRKKSSEKAKALSLAYSWERCSDETFQLLQEIIKKQNKL